MRTRSGDRILGGLDRLFARSHHHGHAVSHLFQPLLEVQRNDRLIHDYEDLRLTYRRGG